MIKSAADLKNYFQAMATALGCSFEYGASERILNRQHSQLIYPVLWLEVPEIQPIRSGGLKRRFYSAFTFLSNADWDDVAGQNARLDEMFLLTEQALQTMQASATDNYPPQFDFDIESSRSEYKQKWSADDDWGWRTEFELLGAMCEDPECCDDDGGTILLPNTPGNLIMAPGGTIAIGAGRLVYAIVILPVGADNDVQIGTTAGGDDIMSFETIEAGNAWTTNAQYYFQSAGSLYFTVSENCTVIVYSR
jgi:hypothetical protein